MRNEIYIDWSINQRKEGYLGDDVEQWWDVPGYEGWYIASNFGQVHSLDRIVENKLPGSNRIRRTPRKGKLLKGNAGPHSLLLRLGKDGEERTWTVHSVILLTFVGPKPVGRQCRHLDGNFRNNRLENLAWGTSQENANDTIRHGKTTKGRPTGLGISKNQGSKHPNAKHTEEEVRVIRELFATGEYSRKELSELLDVPFYFVDSVVSGRVWKHVI